MGLQQPPHLQHLTHQAQVVIAWMTMKKMMALLLKPLVLLHHQLQLVDLVQDLSHRQVD
jgi:hypothetical protein